MKKTICILVFLAVFVSCAVQHKWKESVCIYKSIWHRDVGFSVKYLILRGSSYYEMYSALGDVSYFGSFKISNDTLCLYPHTFNYYHRDQVRILKEEEASQEVSFSNVPSYYKIKGNKLINITDYGQYPELEQWLPDKIKPNEYIRVKNI